REFPTICGVGARSVGGCVGAEDPPEVVVGCSVRVQRHAAEPLAATQECLLQTLKCLQMQTDSRTRTIYSFSTRQYCYVKAHECADPGHSRRIVFNASRPATFSSRPKPSYSCHGCWGG